MATLGVGEDDWRHAETQDEEQYATMSIQELLDAWEKQRFPILGDAVSFKFCVTV